MEESSTQHVLQVVSLAKEHVKHKSNSNCTNTSNEERPSSVPTAPTAAHLTARLDAQPLHLSLTSELNRDMGKPGRREASTPRALLHSSLPAVALILKRSTWNDTDFWKTLGRPSSEPGAEHRLCLVSRFFLPNLCYWNLLFGTYLEIKQVTAVMYWF